MVICLQLCLLDRYIVEDPQYRTVNTTLAIDLCLLSGAHIQRLDHLIMSTIALTWVAQGHALLVLSLHLNLAQIQGLAQILPVILLALHVNSTALAFLLVMIWMARLNAGTILCERSNLGCSCLIHLELRGETRRCNPGLALWVTFGRFD